MCCENPSLRLVFVHLHYHYSYQFVSDPRKNSIAKASGTPSRKATVVKVIRGSNGAAAPAKAQAPTEEPTPQVAKKPVSELEHIHRVVNQASRTRFRDFSERQARPDVDQHLEKRMARGPYFPMATALRFASLFYILGRLCIVASLGTLVWFSFTDQKNYWMLAPMLAVAIFFTFIAWGMSNGLRCRVCTMPFLSKRKCKMNQKAPKLPFLSHHFTVALHILVHNHPRCPYCGTTNRLKS